MVFFFGPVLYGFIHDILKSALAAGKQRVYFISRDGRPLKIVADEIIAAYDYPVETRYIYGSRQSWRQAAIFEPRYDLSWIGENFSGANFSLRHVLERIDDDADKMFSLLPDKLQSDFSLDRSPSDEEIQRLHSAMTFHPPLREHVLKVAEIKRKGALSYFERVGLFDNVPYALVDIGWTGKMQNCLYSILQSKDADIHIDEYYFALKDHDAGFESDYDNRKHYYFIDMHLSGFYLFTLYLELLVQGDHGRCVGYDADGEPLFFGDGQYLRDWGVHEYYECLKTYVTEYARVAHDVSYLERFKHLSKDLAEYYFHPTEQMAELFGALPFSEDQNDALIDEYAPALSRADAVAAMQGTLRLRWKEGSLLRSSPYVRGLFRQKKLLERGKNSVKTVCDWLRITPYVRRLLRRPA